MENIRIYYYRTTEISLFGDVEKINMNETHIEVYSMNLEVTTDRKLFLDMIFSHFNNDYNPLIYNQEIIIENRLHTSMSVGDVVQIGDETWICKGIDWVQI